MVKVRLNEAKNQYVIRIADGDDTIKCMMSASAGSPDRTAAEKEKDAVDRARALVRKLLESLG